MHRAPLYIVTVVGYEMGGATGKFDLGTIVVVPTIAKGVKVPVIGGGGVVDGRGFLAVLSLGAEAVIIGTRLLATKECPIHDRLKQALLNATELDTMIIMMPPPPGAQRQRQQTLVLKNSLRSLPGKVPERCTLKAIWMQVLSPVGKE